MILKLENFLLGLAFAQRLAPSSGLGDNLRATTKIREEAGKATKYSNATARTFHKVTGKQRALVSCADSPVGWYDADGPYFDCNWYATVSSSACQSYGDSYENFGTTANQACCVCGGGADATGFVSDHHIAIGEVQPSLTLPIVKYQLPSAMKNIMKVSAKARALTSGTSLSSFQFKNSNGDTVGTLNLSPENYETVSKTKEFDVPLNDVVEIQMTALSPAAMSDLVLTTDAIFRRGNYGYYVTDSDETMTWDGHDAAAKALGGNLASILDQGENDFLSSIIDTSEAYWLGGFKSGGSWKWSDGSAWGYTDWYPGEPNDHNGIEDKLNYHWARNHQWNDGSGALSLRAVYKFSLPFPPTQGSSGCSDLTNGVNGMWIDEQYDNAIIVLAATGTTISQCQSLCSEQDSVGACLHKRFINDPTWGTTTPCWYAPGANGVVDYKDRYGWSDTRHYAAFCSPVPTSSPSLSPSSAPSLAPSSTPTDLSRAEEISAKIDLFEESFAELHGSSDMPLDNDFTAILERAKDWVIHDDTAKLTADDVALIVRYSWAVLNLDVSPEGWQAFSPQDPNNICQWAGIQCDANGKMSLQLDYSNVELSGGRKIRALMMQPASVLRNRLRGGWQRFVRSSSQWSYTVVPAQEPSWGIEMTDLGEAQAEQLAEGGSISEALATAGAFDDPVALTLASLFQISPQVIAGSGLLTVTVALVIAGTSSTGEVPPLTPRPTSAPSFMPSISNSPTPYPSSQPSLSNAPSEFPSSAPSSMPSLSSAPSQFFLVGAKAPYYKEIHGDPDHRTHNHPENAVISKLLPYYKQNPNLFKSAVRAIEFQNEYPSYPRYPEETRQPGYVASIPTVPLEDQEAFANEHLNRTKSCPEISRPQEVQYQRWKWATENIETFVNMMRLSGHEDTAIQNMFDGMPMWAIDSDVFLSFRRELAEEAKSLEEELNWRNIVFVFTGSSVNGFSQNPCKGSKDTPSWITSSDKSDVDISIHAGGVNEFAAANADIVKSRPTTADFQTTGMRYSPKKDGNGVPRYDIFGQSFHAFYQKWSNILPGGLQFTAYEDNLSIPEWESRAEYAR